MSITDKRAWRDEVLEVRNVDGRLHIARKERLCVEPPRRGHALFYGTRSDEPSLAISPLVAGEAYEFSNIALAAITIVLVLLVVVY